MAYGLDKHDRVIKPGMTVKNSIGHEETVLENVHGELGIKAPEGVDPAFLDVTGTLFLLTDFDRKEFEIVKNVETN